MINGKSVGRRYCGEKKTLCCELWKKFFIHNFLRFVNEIYDGIVSRIDCSVAFLWVVIQS